MMTVIEALEKKKGHAFAHLQEQFWIQIIDESLRAANGNSREAVRSLGISYETFNNWRKRLGIDSETYKTAESQVNLRNKIEDALNVNASAKEAAVYLGFSDYKMAKLMKHFKLESRFFNRVTREEITENMHKFKRRYQLAEFLGLEKKTLSDYMKRYSIQDPWAWKE